MTKKDLPELVRVAEEIEADLAKLEELSHSASHIRLHNEKSIALAGRKLQDGLDQQEQLANGLRALGAAMMNMQQRQAGAITRLSARAHEIQAQVKRLAEHMDRFGALGAKASEATRILEALPPPYGQGKASEAPASGPPEQLLAVDVLLASVSAEAKSLATSAEAADLSDVTREATALRQRVEAARSQLALLTQARPPQVH